MSRRPLTVLNATNAPQRLTIEPWAEEYVLEPRQTASIVFSGKETAMPSLVIYEEGLSIYAEDGDHFEIAIESDRVS